MVYNLHDALHRGRAVGALHATPTLLQEAIMAVKTYNAGVKEYRQTYWMPEYTPIDTDILACFKITPQPGVDREEVAAAVEP